MRAWREGTIELGLNGPGSTTSSSATIGTTAAQVVISSGTFTVGDTDMNEGESIEFLVENLEVQLTDTVLHGSAFFDGFSAAFLTQIANTANSHQAVFGSGENLLGYDFNSNQRSGTLDVGHDELYVSADLGVRNPGRELGRQCRRLWN